MFKVKCFTFIYTAILATPSVTDYVLDEQFLELTVNGYNVSPYIKLIPTSKKFSEYNSLNLIDGLIANFFNVISCKVNETGKELIINAVFTLEFDLDSPVELINNEIIYPQEGDKYQEDMGNYSFNIEGSFTSADAPSLSESVEINSVITLETKVSIEEMTM